MHFEQQMFTNSECNRLKHNAVPTLFPALEGSSRDTSDHTYSRKEYLKLDQDQDIKSPCQKIQILQNTVIVPGS